ncbi:MAG TPA: aldo/keto reductase [Candidatus Acidoferrales bacterium]|nr:aldo/keto reductase [Candidatus Acidoferrales bacterium]
MEFKELGKSGIKISAIGIGTWQWGSREWGWGRRYGKSEVLEAFRTALDSGINFVDTAEIYGRGKSEEILGEAIRDHREDVVIASKIWPFNLSRRHIMRAADRSRHRLGVDVIDLYQIHWPNPLFPIQNTMKSMRRLVEAGKVRCVGVSNFNLERMKTSQEALAPLELASNQVKYSMLDRGIKSELLPYAESAKVTVIAYSPLAFGLLSGRYTPDSKPSSIIQATNYRFSKRNLIRLNSLLQVLSEVANVHGKTLSQVALNYLISSSTVVAIPGGKRPEHVADSAGAADWRMSENESQKISAALSTLRFDKLSGVPNLLTSIRYL